MNAADSSSGEIPKSTRTAAAERATRPTDAPARPDFAAHRDRLLARLQPDEAVLLFGGTHHHRNADTEYKYRPDSDIWWLTGWEDPEVAVFLRPGTEPFILFCQPKDREREVWTGIRPGPEGARERFGADTAYPIPSIEDHLPRLLQGVTTLHYGWGRDADHDAMVRSAIDKSLRTSRKSFLQTPEVFVHPSRLIHELRLVKQADELAVMRESTRLTGLGHRAAMAFARPGRTETQVEALVDWTFRAHGGNGPGYTTIVAGGRNACILHYVTNREPLRAGELLLLDAGCEYQNYTGDVTRTFPIDGRFTAPQRRVYEHVLAAQLASIEAARAGRPFRDVHDASVRRLTEGMLDLGLLTGSVDEHIEKETFKRYYMHGTSHWLGIDVHDAGMYARDARSRALVAGMILTVEPGLYIPIDDASEEFRGIGIRIEDDILITDGDPENLTVAVPKTIEAVEAACGASLEVDF